MVAVVGKHVNIIADLMRRIPRKVDTQYISKGLSVNPEETMVMLLTRRSTIIEVIRLEY